MTVRMQRALAQACAVVAVCTVMAAPAAAKSWRIGLAGGRVTGYIGTLAGNGINRECMLDERLTSAEELGKYDLIIISPGVGGDAGAISQAVAKYVEAGGIAITEVTVAPPTTVLPGKRLGPAPGPNLTFAGRDNPISAPLKGAGIIAVQARAAMAIVPDDLAKVTVLAEFTDDGVNAKYAGKLTGGQKHVPAILLFDYGKGKWLYCGADVATSLALSGPQLQPYVLAALRNLTGGEVVPRLTTLPSDRWLLPTVEWSPQPPPDQARIASPDEPAADLPEGFEALDLPSDANTEFVLTGQVMSGEPAEVLLSWHNSNWQRAIRFSPSTIEAVAVNGGRERVVCQVQRPSSSETMEPIVIQRQPQSVTVLLAGQAVLGAALDSMRGTVATSGLVDAYCQQTAPVYYDDDFMRAEGEASTWDTVSGKWELHKVEGEAAQGANPFAFKANSDTLAAAVTGYSFWDDY
ncbi:MAG TPA: hypothetical protein VM283_02940, partial [Armatimonadota bacterium]|nr:hypothetical protein [Armatimonadota bacterium]